MKYRINSLGSLTWIVFALYLLLSVIPVYRIIETDGKHLEWPAILWLYLSVAILFGGSIFYLSAKGKLQSEPAKKLSLVLAGLFCAFYVSEIILRLSKTGTTYTEQREGFFVNPAERMTKNWYATWKPNSHRTIQSPEYNYSRFTNSEGLSDVEWNEQKDTNEIRIMALGDSFTEGDGAPFDSTYPRLLQGLLQKEFPEVKINVLNAGRAGSDPWFEFKKFNDRLLKYQPDIVLYTIGGNDLFTDHLHYGGMERFVADSTVRNNIPKHAWLPLYEVSYVFRLLMNIVGYDNSLFGKDERRKNEATAIEDAREISKQFSRLAADYNFMCVQLLKPGKHEVKQGDFRFNSAGLTEFKQPLPYFETINLLSFYKDSLGINDKTVNDYYWQVDNHHNSTGYAAMAQAVLSGIQPIIIKKMPEVHP
ncbi:MAG: GDSL-type esterase/lipase family protein [Bacteroidota bacterium]